MGAGREREEEEEDNDDDKVRERGGGVCVCVVVSVVESRQWKPHLSISSHIHTNIQTHTHTNPKGHVRKTTVFVQPALGFQRRGTETGLRLSLRRRGRALHC